MGIPDILKSTTVGISNIREALFYNNIVGADSVYISFYFKALGEGISRGTHGIAKLTTAFPIPPACLVDNIQGPSFMFPHLGRCRA